MSFPSNPSNGQTTVVNGTTYIYNSSYNSWTKQAIPVLSIVQEPSSMTPRYPLFVANTSGNVSVVNVDSVELSYVPGTGTLNATNINIGSVDVLDYIITYNLAFG